MSAASNHPPSRRLLLHPKALERRALELMTSGGPRATAERMAAAEAHLRLYVTSEPQAKLLHRGVSLDPYRADLHHLAGRDAHPIGADVAALATAVRSYDHALLLAPSTARVRLDRGRALLAAARTTGATELAEAAREDLAAAGAWTLAIEAAIYGRASRLREQLPEIFAKVPPSAPHKDAVTRLLYQAIFAFGVGKAKNVDALNRKTMGEIADVAQRWLAAFPGDAALSGVIAAAAAKQDSAEVLCEKVDDYARRIPELRIVRLLLRERLADVSDPQRRLELFERAMAKIPLLDGIAHDYLQLVHLVAKRALAVGDLAAARAAWETCLTHDPDNPGAVHNLLRLARFAGDEARVAELHAKQRELWAIYAEHSPRAGHALDAAAAEVAAEAKAALEKLQAATQKDERPTAKAVWRALMRRVLADALYRLAEDDDARAATALAERRALVAHGDRFASTFEAALRVTSRPTSAALPVAYAYLDAAKDATPHALAAARDEVVERLAHLRIAVEQEGKPATPLQELSSRAMAETQPLLEPASRAAYDAGTAAPGLTERVRQHVKHVLDLLFIAQSIGDAKLETRVKLAGDLAKLKSGVVRAYLPTSERDEAWFDRACARVAYGKAIRDSFEEYQKGRAHVAVDTLKPLLEGGRTLFELQALYAMAVAEDDRRDLHHGVATARRQARAALEVFHYSDPSELRSKMERFATNPEEELAQEVAAERALNALNRGDAAAAARVLLLAYPGRRKATQQWIPGEAFADLRPAGRGQYAWVVGRTMRAGTVEWFNEQHPTTQWEHQDNQRRAAAILAGAQHWASYAKGTLPNDPLPPGYIAAAMQNLEELVDALFRDRATLGG